MNSIMETKKDSILIILFWLLVWQILSVVVGAQILLPSPLVTFVSLFELLTKGDTYLAIGISTLKISLGFIMSMITGTFFAFIAYKNKLFKKLISPIMMITKAVPVACFIILLLVWLSSRSLSMVICFMMGLPIFYSNTLTGIENIPKSLLEMSKVFKLSNYVKLRYIYTPMILPYFKTACALALGLCFKAAIAAEILGLPNNSIGENLYNAKIFLDMPDLFAWTIIIIFMSYLMEYVYMKLVQIICKKCEVIHHVKN